MLLAEGVTGTDPVRGHEILFNVRCTGDLGRSFQPEVFCITMGSKRQTKLKHTAPML